MVFLITERSIEKGNLVGNCFCLHCRDKGIGLIMFQKDEDKKIIY